ncbi:MAG: hypothetical protein J6A28_01075 [Clostridia bacterium]|nr:hypothetical protein [Clostridia bacterium]
MKETAMLFGFGLGLITGALLYKYNTCAKKIVDKGEKAVMDEVENMEQKAKKAIKQVESNMEKKAEKVKNA